MKLYYYNAVSPVFGSAHCDSLAGMGNFNKDGIVEMDPQECAEIWDTHQPELEEFLEKETCNLAEYLDGHGFDGEDLKGCIRSIVPHVWGVSESKGHFELELCTRIIATEELSEKKLDALRNYLIGQLSDGWGEGVEQREIFSIPVTVPSPEFEPANLSISQDGFRDDISVYFHLWRSSDFYCIVEYETCEEVEDPVPQDAEIKIAASLCVTRKGNGYLVRNVYMANCKEAALIWLDKRKDVMDVNWHMEELNKMPKAEGEEEFYFVTEFTGATTRILPRLDVYRATGSRFFTYRPSDGEHFPDRVELHTESHEELPHNLALLAEV